MAVNIQTNAGGRRGVVREIVTAARGRPFALQGDVGTLAGIRSDSSAALDAELTRRQGGPGFDILVNNAGIGREGTSKPPRRRSSMNSWR